MKKNFISSDIVEAFVANIDLNVERDIVSFTTEQGGVLPMWVYTTTSDDTMVQGFVKYLEPHTTEESARSGIDEARAEIVTKLTTYRTDHLCYIFGYTPGLMAMIDDDLRRSEQARAVAS